MDPINEKLEALSKERIKAEEKAKKIKEKEDKIRAENALALAWKNYHGYEKAATFKRGYFSGAVTAIKTKLNAQRIKNEQTHIGLTALVRTNEVALTQKAYELFPGHKPTAVRQLSSNDGHTKGYIDGSRLEHNQGLEGSIKDQKALN